MLWGYCIWYCTHVATVVSRDPILSPQVFPGQNVGIFFTSIDQLPMISYMFSFSSYLHVHVALQTLFLAGLSVNVSVSFYLGYAG